MGVSRVMTVVGLLPPAFMWKLKVHLLLAFDTRPPIWPDALMIMVSDSICICASRHHEYCHYHCSCQC